MNAIDIAVLKAVSQLSPHAGWAEIARVANMPRHEVKGALDRLQAVGWIEAGHWHEGRQHERLSDAGRAALASM